MVPDMGTRLTWQCRLGKEGSVPRAPGSPKLCHPSPTCHNRGLVLPGRWVLLRARSLTLLQENALGERRLLRLGMKRFCESGGERWMQQAGTRQHENASAWGKSRWQLASEKGHCDVPSTSHLLPGKGISRPPTHRSAGTVRHPSLCQASQPALPH